MAVNKQKLTDVNSVEAVRPSRKDLRGNREFRMVHYPNHWNFDDTSGEFLPGLKTFSATPGCNGTPQNGNLSNVRSMVADRGGIFLEIGEAGRRQGLGEYADYVEFSINDANQRHFHTQWTTFDQIGNRVFPRHDEQGAKDFARYLVEKGIVRPLHPQIKEQLIDAQRRRVNGVRNRPNRDSEAQAQQDRLDAMRQGVSVAAVKEARENPTSPKPARKPRAAKSAGVVA